MLSCLYITNVIKAYVFMCKIDRVVNTKLC